MSNVGCVVCSITYQIIEGSAPTPLSLARPAGIAPPNIQFAVWVMTFKLVHA